MGFPPMGMVFNLDHLREFLNTLEFKFLLSLLVGFLIGLEREIRGKLGQDIFAGIRTFPLIALLGTLSALISDRYQPYFLPLSFFGIILLAAVNYQLGVLKRSGITTEIAVFLTFSLGVLTYYGLYYEVALLGVVITFILATKRILENFAKLLDKEDILLILQFLVVSVLIYPLLPSGEIFNGLNLKLIWKFVILVSSISFLGYFLLKIYASKKEKTALVKSILITSILGGSVSSTAITLAFSKLAKEIPNLSVLFFVGITLAWAVMGIRVVILASLIAPELFVPLIKLFIPFIALMLVVALWVFKNFRREWDENLKLQKGVEIKNPFSWIEIFQFALIYSAVMVLGKYLKLHFGSKGIIFLSITSGVIDVDPLTLALSEMFNQKLVNLNLTVLGILLATISNNFFKAFYAYLFGSKILRKLITTLLVVNILYALGSFLII